MCLGCCLLCVKNIQSVIICIQMYKWFLSGMAHNNPMTLSLGRETLGI